MLQDIDPNQVALLVIGSFSGTLVRTIYRPEKTWRSWLGQSFAGTICGIFIGGYVANVLEANAEATAFIAFIIGTCAESTLALAQSRIAAAAQNGSNKPGPPAA